VVLWNYSAIQEMENSSMKLKQDWFHSVRFEGQAVFVASARTTVIVFWQDLTFNSTKIFGFNPSTALI
jgi:hypothetical protein